MSGEEIYIEHLQKTFRRWTFMLHTKADATWQTERVWCQGEQAGRAAVALKHPTYIGEVVLLSVMANKPTGKPYIDMESES